MGSTDHKLHISGKQAARYMLLPEIMPRIRALGGSGFGYLAFLIATIYQSVRILPAGHAYTNPANIGTFGLRDVLGAAAGHVKLEWRNIDQILVYFAVMAGVGLLFVQFAALIVLLFSGQAFADEAGLGTPDQYSFFVTQNPEKDVAFMLLDYVFGIPKFFGSSALAGGEPTAFHTALHTLIKFYNMAILVVAVLIFLYYIIVVVVETAQSGTPFGQRFNSVYAPIRLVIAIGLLVPLNYGFNGAQYITLYAAKIGSSFATNGWLRFNETLDNPLGAKPKDVIARPVIPDLSAMTEFMAVVHACKAAYERKHDAAEADIEIKRYLIVDGTAHPMPDVGSMYYDDAVKKTKGGDLKITFGEYNPSKHTAYEGGVAPYCGVLNIPVGNFDVEKPVMVDGEVEFGLIKLIGVVFYNMHDLMWYNKDLADMAEKLAKALDRNSDAADDRYKINETDIESIKSKEQTSFDTMTVSSYNAAAKNVDITMSEEIKNRGWGGAGIWYNRIAEANGAYLGTLFNTPAPSAYPTVLEKVQNAKKAADADYTACERFNPNLAKGEAIQFDGLDKYYARVMYKMHQGWSCKAVEGSKNFFWDAMHLVFGVRGLFDMKCNNNTEAVHPLAQLTAVGKGLIDSSVRNMAMSMGASFLGGAAGVLGDFGPDASAILNAASGFFTTTATIGLSIGFLLFYILPFMPFLYFFFAVSAWVKGVFEAMVGVPLWALAHIKIDGQGLPGDSAMNGYFLIFEIFLRPITVVFGLIGGMALFGASVAILNDIFDIAVHRLTGTDLANNSMCVGGNAQSGDQVAKAIDDAGRLDKHILDEFFFTIIYAIFVYLIAMSCFKMIDLVPNGIMRWLGASISPFASEVQDPTENLAQYAAISGATIGGRVMSGLNQGAAAGGHVIGATGELAGKMNKES